MGISAAARVRLALKQRLDYQLDAISISLIIFNVLLSTYLVTVAVNLQAFDIAFKSVLMLLLTITGLVGFVIIFGRFPAIDHSLTVGEISEIVACSTIGFIFVLMMQTAVIKTYPLIYSSITDVLTLKLLLTNIAIGEEVFFRFFLQSTITKQISYAMPQTHTVITGITGTSLIFAIYHYVYSGMASLLLAVFVSSLVLGTVYAVTKRPSVPMLIHILVNLT